MSLVKSWSMLRLETRLTDAAKSAGAMLVVDVILGRVHRAGHVFRLHAAEVEEHDDQTASLNSSGLAAKSLFTRSATVFFSGGAISVVVLPETVVASARVTA